MADYEVEMKFPHPNLEAFVESLIRLQDQEIGPTILETDTYFDRIGIGARDDQPAVGQLRRKDEWLRIRCRNTTSCKGEEFITYKGPRIDAETKTRIEIESPIKNGLELLRHLGFREILQIKKYRREARFVHGEFNIKVLLDDVWDLGSFVELELSSPSSGKDKAIDALKSVAKKLQLGPPENSGYAILLLERAENPS